jgi:hypothetical protein
VVSSSSGLLIDPLRAKMASKQHFNKYHRKQLSMEKSSSMMVADNEKEDFACASYSQEDLLESQRPLGPGFEKDGKTDCFRLETRESAINLLDTQLKKSKEPASRFY